MTPITVLVPDDLKSFLDREANGNIGLYLCALVQAAQTKAREARLESLLLAGLASEAIPFDARFRARLHTRIEQILAPPP